MSTTTESHESSTPPQPPKATLAEQLAAVLSNAVDYATSSIRLIQAEAAAIALSSVTFLVLILITILTGFVAFVLLSVAMGIWISHLTSSVGWALVIMGGFYTLLAVLAGVVAFRWLIRLRS